MLEYRDYIIKWLYLLSTPICQVSTATDHPCLLPPVPYVPRKLLTLPKHLARPLVRLSMLSNEMMKSPSEVSMAVMLRHVGTPLSPLMYVTASSQQLPRKRGF